MAFLEKTTGHYLRMNTTERVMANSVGIVYTLGMLSHIGENLNTQNNTSSNYQKVLRLYKKTGELVQESELTLDRAIRLKMDVTEKMVYPFVEACLIVAEDVQRFYLDKLDAVSRSLPQSTQLQMSQEPEPIHSCVICVADLDQVGRVAECPSCGRNDICPQCDMNLKSCPFCRTTFG
jgi:hypothetical protein